MFGLKAKRASALPGSKCGKPPFLSFGKPLGFRKAITLLQTFRMRVVACVDLRFID